MTIDELIATIWKLGGYCDTPNLDVVCMLMFVAGIVVILFFMED